MTKGNSPRLPQWSINIKELRNALRTDERGRVSQEKLSDLLQPFHPERRSVSQTTVGKWEAGTQEPTVGEFEALAELARERGLRDVTPEWIAFNRGKVPAFIDVLTPQLPLTSALDEEDERDASQNSDRQRLTAGEDRSRRASSAAAEPNDRGKRRRPPRT